MYTGIKNIFYNFLTRLYDAYALRFQKLFLTLPLGKDEGNPPSPANSITPWHFIMNVPSMNLRFLNKLQFTFILNIMLLISLGFTIQIMSIRSYYSILK